MKNPVQQPVGTRLMLVDALVLLTLSAVAVSPLLEAYGGWRWLLAAVVGTALGLGLAALSRWLRWGPIVTALALFVIYLIFGPALAAPSEAAFGVLPGPQGLRSVLTGLVTAWRDSLTMVTPLGSLGNVLVVPWVLGLVSGLLGGVFLWRSRFPGVAAVVLAGTFMVAAAFGDRVTGLTLSRGLVLAICLLVWTRWRAMRDVRVAWARRLALTAAVLLTAGLASSGLALATMPHSRDVLRDHVEPPFDPQDYPSPLSRYRAFSEERLLGDKVLFRTAGLAKGDRIRLATMDTFDGVVWNVAGGPQAPTESGSFGRLAPQSAAKGERDVEITVVDYSGPWVPTFGMAREADVRTDGRLDTDATRRLLFNKATGTMAQLGGVRSGATYRFRTLPPAEIDDPETYDAAPSVRPAAPPDIPALTKRVQRWMGEAGSPAGGAAAAVLADEFQKGYYSDGLPGQAGSPAGHGIKRLTDLVAPEALMIGNDEQYASAMGVASQQQGLPARVVLGFVVPDATGEIKGADVQAWVEVDLTGVGWVAFAPTPDENRKPKQLQEDPQPQPQPNVLQPPVVPTEPDDTDKRAPQGAGKKIRNQRDPILQEVVAWAKYPVGALAVTSPIWGVLLLKRVRRSRRRRRGSPSDRVAAGWREVTDRACDLGVKLPASHTRVESVQSLIGRYPSADLGALAARADEHAFGPDDATDAEAKEYWSQVGPALSRLRKSAPRWRRPLVVLSLASVPWRAAITGPFRAFGVVLRRVWLRIGRPLGRRRKVALAR
ncbi:MAG: transglutaminaseTgpA domain-containing protein [Nocardioides sp.]